MKELILCYLFGPSQCGTIASTKSIHALN